MKILKRTVIQAATIQMEDWDERCPEDRYAVHRVAVVIDFRRRSKAEAIKMIRLGAKSQAEIADFADFVSLDLFPPNRIPYTHQQKVFEESVVNGRDVVVTTGTGSGKTECFFLPILASIVRESAAWGPPGNLSPPRH